MFPVWKATHTLNNSPWSASELPTQRDTTRSEHLFLQPADPLRQHPDINGLLLTLSLYTSHTHIRDKALITILYEVGLQNNVPRRYIVVFFSVI